jgi:hypothetical protein
VVVTARSRLLSGAGAALCAGAVAAPAPATAAAWTTPALVTQRADVQFDLAVGADGTAAAAWQADGVRVAVKRLGRPWSSPRLVSDGRRLTGRPAVTVTGRGEVVVAWPQSAAARSSRLVRAPLTIRSRTRGSAGSWGAERTLGTSGHFSEAGIDLAADDRGEAIAVWRGVLRLSSARRADAIQSAFRRPATAFGGAQTLRDPADASAGAGTPAVTLDELGIAHVAWSGGRGPSVRLATRTRGARGAWQRARAIGAAPSSNPQIAAGGDRSATIAWRAAAPDSEGDGVQSGELEARTRHTSGALGNTQRVSGAAVSSFRLATGALGQAVLTWVPRSAAEADADLRVATRAAAPGRFGAPETLAGVRAEAFHGGAALLPDGTTLVAAGQDPRSRVFARAPGAAFAAPPELDVAGRYVLLAAAGEHVVAAWNTIDGDRVGLQAAVRSRASR